ncbi:MAG: gluconate:H+ symporter [Chitinophagaceae bacterium]
MTLFIVLCCIIGLVLLISWGKINAFIAFLIVAITAGLLLGIPFSKITQSVQKGIGDTLGSLVIVIALGAMLGKLVAESGAAQQITNVLLKWFGKKNMQWALMVTGFIVGIPLFYNVGFVLMIPLIFSAVYQMKMPAVYVGVPMLAALSVTHGFLPPHPAPSALVAQFGANMGMTLFYGTIISIPAIILAGPVFAKTLKHIKSEPLKTFHKEMISDEFLPSPFVSFFASLLPVLLLAVTTMIPFFYSANGLGKELLSFFSEPSIVMLVALLAATFLLGVNSNRTISEVMDIYVSAVKDVSVILLIVAGAGALKQIFSDSGVSMQIAEMLKGLSIHPLVLGWTIAAVIRVAIGSATVAGLTAAGIIAPVIATYNVNPSLMVLSIGAGSLMFSHVNDSGFWMFKEYFNLTIRQTIRSWSLMETIVAVVGLAGVMALDLFV